MTPREPTPEGTAAPLVSVVMPVRNEAATLRESLGSLLAQDFPAERMEILVVDGGSTDGTREIAAEIADGIANRARVAVRVLDNPRRHAAAAMNAGIAAARGGVVIRLDGHAVAAPDFVRRSVGALEETGAACTGGVMASAGEGPARRAVALAMSTRFGAGSAAFRVGSPGVRDVDTVAFGAYRRETLLALGGFDETFPRNQDDELNLRLRRAGGRIVLDPAIRATYVCRRGPLAAARQYAGYGFHKARVLRRHGTLGSLRAYAPAALVAALVLGAAASIAAGSWLPLAVVALPYAAANLAASCATGTPLAAAAYAALHLGYGAGFWAGVLALPFDRSQATLPFSQPDARRDDVRAVFARRDARPQPEDAALLAARARTFRRLLEPMAPRRVLDVGCGRGTSLASLPELGFGGAAAHGVDLLPERLAHADARLAAADAARLPYRDGAFDAVLLFTALGSIPDDAARRRAAEEALRVVGEHGVVLVWEMRLARPGGDGRAFSARALRALFPGCDADAATVGFHHALVVRKAPPAPRGLPRAAEIALAALALAVSAPLLLVAALAVRATSRGPALYRAVRTGRRGRPFTKLKLRSMRVAPGPAITAADDARITAVGRVLRALHADELPQLWNVLRGDMSLVGPRPEDPRFVDPGDPRWRRILSVRPGITGPTQLAFAPREAALLRGRADPERVYRDDILPAKLASDLAYVASRSARGDLACLLRTVTL